MTAAEKKIIEPGKYYVEFGRNGNVANVYYEDSYRRLLGYEGEEEYANTQDNWLLSVHSDDLERVKKHFAECVRKHPEGMDFDIEYRMMTKTGYRWVHDYATMVRWADGSPMRAHGVVFDIQVAVYQNAQLEERPDNIRRLMGVMQSFASDYDPIIVIEPYSGEYDWYMREVVDVTDVTSMTIHGESLYKNIVIDSINIIHEDDREHFRNFFSRENMIRIAETGLPQEGENRWFIETDKKYHWKYNKVFRMIDENGRALVVCGVKDTTEEKKKEAERQQKDRKTEEIIRSFAKDYSAVYLGNLRDGSFTILILSQNEKVVRQVSGSGLISAALQRYVAESVHPADRKLFRKELFSVDEEKVGAAVGGTVSFEYRSNSGGEYLWYRAVFNRLNENELLVGFKECDTEVTSRMLNDKLLGKYDSLYTVDLNSDAVRPLRASRVSRVGNFLEKRKYSELLKKFAETVDPKYKQDWLNFSNPEYMKKYMADEDQREYTYELPEAEQSLRRFTIDVLERIDGEAAVLLFSFMGIDDLQAQALRLQQKMAEQSVLLEKSLATVSAEKNRYDVLHEIIKSGQWSFAINEADEIVRADYSAGVKEIIGNELPPDPLAWRTIVHPDDQKAAFAAFDAAVADHSGKTPYDVNFRMIDRNGNYNWFRSAGRVVRNEDGSGEFFGIHVNINERIEAEKQRLLVEKTELQLQHEHLRSEVLNFMMENDDDPIELLKNFAERLRVLISCDQVIYRDLEETRIMVNSPAIEKTWAVPVEYCQQCEHFDAHHPMYKDGYTEMANCQEGWQGIPVYEKCPIKSSLTRIVYCDNEVAGYLAIHYVKDYHQFTDIERGTVEEFARILSISLSRYAARKENKELKLIAEMQEQLQESLAFTNYFLRTYRSVYYMHLDDLTCQEYKRSAEIAQEYPLTGNYLEVINDYIEKGVHPEDRAVMREIMKPEYLRKTLQEKPELIHVYRDLTGGTEKFAQFQAIRGADENHVAFGFKDVTEEVRAEQKRQRDMEEALSMAQAANRAKTTFLNNMSHDIRTPMNAIIGFTGLAASHIDNKERVQDYLGKIGQSSEHLLSLINDVLDMSRIESGKMNIDEKNENLSDIIHTLRDIVQAGINAKHHDFFIDTVNVNDEQIICDKLRLNQVLLNILSNSIKYTAAGGTISMRITEKTVKLSGYATYEFSIKDNGMGMDKDFLKTLFDPFTRMKSSTVSGIQGTGLGMAITKNIVDMMGGTIDVESELGKGTTITVTFDFMLQSAPKVPMEIPELKGLRGLVVDDDTNTCLSICSMLLDIGMRDEWCTTGKEAVVRAESAFQRGDLFKVYIIDWLMPDMNGIETTRRIRKVIGNDAPIIILTAYDWSGVEDEAREAGVTAFVSKPLFPSDLHRILNKCLGKDEEVVPETDMPDFHGKKVLIVEDNELNLEIAGELLLEYGFEIDTAEDGHIAVAKMKAAKAGDYDLVLMDVQMPTMDGYEATRQIRALGTEISKIPILAMTANAFEEDRRKAIEAGMDDHIAKPIDIIKLKETLAKFI